MVTLRLDLPEHAREPLPYNYEISNDEKNQLKIWEAARATSAVPMCFRHANGQKYWDGALYYSNPATAAKSEAQRLWPCKNIQHPDLLLSVGSGRADRLPAMSKLFRAVADAFDAIGVEPLLPELTVLNGCLQESINSEAIWTEEFAPLVRDHPHRYIRLNPNFPAPLLSFDDVEALEKGEIEKKANEYLETDDARREIDRITRCLISTSFYFQPTETPSQQNTGDFKVTGMQPTSNAGLGIRKYMTEPSRPHPLPIYRRIRNCQSVGRNHRKARGYALRTRASRLSFLATNQRMHR